MVSGGVSESVIVTIARQSAYWEAARNARSRTLLPGDENPPGFVRVPIGNQGIDPRSTLACLTALRQQSGYRDAFQDFSPGPGTRSWEFVVVGGLFLCVAVVFGIMALGLAEGHRESTAADLAIPLAMAALAIWMIRFGWRRRR